MDETLIYTDLLERRKATLDGLLGIEIVEIGDQGIVLTLPVTPKIHQVAGMVHGGIYLVMAESAAGIHAARLCDLSKEFPVGIEISASHLSSVSEGTLLAKAVIAQRSRSFTVHTVEIRHAESEELLSVARVTNYFKELRG